MRGELSCAACDNAKEKFFTDASKLALKASDVQNLGFCVQFMAKFNSYKTLLGDMLAFAATMKIDTKAAQAKLDALKWSTDANCASGATPAAPAKKDDKKPATPAKKDDKKPAAPAKKDEKKPAAPAKKERILQAPVKKDDKKPAAPAKKDEKKPATP